MDDETEINITPMLDIVFIMLIFFIVTTSFVKEQGLEVSRPSNAPPMEVQQDQQPIVIRIDHGSLISLDGRLLEPLALEANLEREKAIRPNSPLVVAAHPDANTEALVNVLNAANSVGIENISVVTSAEP